MAMHGFYFITDSELSRAGNMSDTMNAVKAGAKIVQYRLKNASSASLYAEALQIKRLCENVTYIINDRIDIALAVNADGVHIGRDDLPIHVVRRLLGPGKIIGVTVRNLEEALHAQANGANYLGVGPIFSTMTKPDAGSATGIALLRDVRKSCRLPLAAIGGLTLNNAKEVILCGADMVCSISSIVAAADVYEAVKAFEQLYTTYKSKEA